MTKEDAAASGDSFRQKVLEVAYPDTHAANAERRHREARSWKEAGFASRGHSREPGPKCTTHHDRRAIGRTSRPFRRQNSNPERPQRLTSGRSERKPYCARNPRRDKRARQAEATYGVNRIIYSCIALFDAHRACDPDNKSLAERKAKNESFVYGDQTPHVGTKIPSQTWDG